jgi:hypothetical protein
MPTSRNATFSLPEELFPFLETRSNKSAYVASLIEQDKEYRAWKGQA